MPLRFFILFFISIGFLYGCNQENQPEEDLQIEQEANKKSEEKILTNKEIAQQLTKVASKVPGVDRAVALVAGPYAIVGLDIEDQLDSSRVGTVKYSVTEALRTDPYGKTALVVADPAITERVKALREKLGQGEPTQAIFDEIASLVARILPLLPKEDQPIERERNMDIEDEESDDLKEIQRKQSTENNEG